MIEYGHYICIFVITLLLIGCEEDLNLRAEFPEPFTLYGMLSPGLNIQSVRVYPIETTPQLAVDNDIQFTSTDLNTGEFLVWEDSLMVSANGQENLIFWSSFVPEHGHVYRVEAQRMADGATSYADVRIPPRVTVRSVDVVSVDPGIADIRMTISGDGIQVHRPELIYSLIPYGALSGEIFFSERVDVRRSHHDSEVANNSDWDVTVNLFVDRLFVQGILTAGIAPNLFILEKLNLEFLVGDASWNPPSGRFDPDLLSHKDALDNVENGLGFVAGAYRTIALIEPGCELVNDAGYGCAADLIK